MSPGLFFWLLLFQSAKLLAGFDPLIERTSRPPNYEAPPSAFDKVLTDDKQFFVRWHLPNIPLVDEAASLNWKLDIEGESVNKPFTLSLNQLKTQFENVELVALTYCAGNRRSLSTPRVPGVQWSSGGMGNARWTGVRLRDILARAELKEQALEVVFDGADTPVLPQTPDFQKSLPLAKAIHPDTIVAFAMNGKPISQGQGAPLKLIVPGWTATYWMKQLISIRVISKPFDGFWVAKGYRIPKGKFSAVENGFPSQSNSVSAPVTEIIVNSLITKVRDASRPRGTSISEFKRGSAAVVEGFAWDGGQGIAKVDVSIDGGKNWKAATLKEDLGKYSWRPFEFQFVASRAGVYKILARATNIAGHTQPEAAVFNASGYHHNVPLKVNMVVK